MNFEIVSCHDILRRTLFIVYKYLYYDTNNEKEIKKFIPQNNNPKLSSFQGLTDPSCSTGEWYCIH